MTMHSDNRDTEVSKNISNGQVVNNEPEPSGTAGKSNEQKTLFDWTEAILVPVVLAIVGIGFTAAQFVITSNKQDAGSADKARETKEQVLTDYGKAIAELMTKDKLGQESSDKSVKNIARGQTLIALRQLDPGDKLKEDEKSKVVLEDA